MPQYVDGHAPELPKCFRSVLCKMGQPYTIFSGANKQCVTSLKLGTGSHTSMAGVLLTSIVVCMLNQPSHPMKHKHQRSIVGVPFTSIVVSDAQPTLSPNEAQALRVCQHCGFTKVTGVRCLINLVIAEVKRNEQRK